jgi:hypothetical protein
MVVTNDGAPGDNSRLMAADTPDAQLAARLERIKQLTEELARAQADSAEAQQLADRIRGEVNAARGALKIQR